jgi:hypothetical protein
MPQNGRRARVAHAIPGRLRIQYEHPAPAPGLDGLDAVRAVPGVLAVEAKPAARSAVIRYDPATTSEAAVLAELARAGIELAAPEPAGAEAGRGAATQPASTAAADRTTEGRSALMEALIGPRPKLDRRFAESLALSAVSLLAARRVGLALGGGTTLPAYFAIWFALRRLTGAGRRR